MVRRFLLIFLLSSLSLVLNFCHPDQPKEASQNLNTSKRKLTEDQVVLKPLLQALEQLRSQRGIDSSTIGYLIIDDTEEQPYVVAEYHPNQLLIPASVQKLLVTGAALEILGLKARHDVSVTNLLSHNGLANKLVRQIGQSVFHDKSTLSGCRAVIEFWREKGVDMTGVTLFDGSGRRYDNSLTARQLVDVLYYQTMAPSFGTFYSSLPLAGISGTMKQMLNGTIAEGKIRAKTGTLAAVKSLAGYVSTLSGRKLIFAIIVNNYTCRNSVMKKQLEGVLVKMTEL
ncbi:MAG: D-alanyl-D-alanine carboxypeptidase/D-alanyl-D-alanine-endopeptidase [bacterium]